MYEVVISGKMGHQQCVAFRKKPAKSDVPAAKAAN
jgi:hypothetical protein